MWDFSWIESGLAEAGSRGGKFGLRVMAYCPGCWMENRAGFPPITPSLVPRQPGGYIPDWNSPAFQIMWKGLITELGRRYGNDPRLGYVDVGGYGSYGEWHVDTGTKVTDANGLSIVKAVADAFSRNHVPINTMTPVEFTLKALKANRNLGLRTDSLGCPDMHAMAAVDRRLQSVWKTRPFFREWCTRADPVLGAAQVKRFHVSTTSSGNMPWTYDTLTARQPSAYRTAIIRAGYRYQEKRLSLPAKIKAGRKMRVRTSWRNTGSAPTYDRWRVQLVFVYKRTGREVVRSLGSPLTRVLTDNTVTARVSTSGLGRGKHRVHVRVVGPSGYLQPMGLANGGRTSKGSYRVGVVTVGPA